MNKVGLIRRKISASENPSDITKRKIKRGEHYIWIHGIKVKKDEYEKVREILKENSPPNKDICIRKETQQMCANCLSEKDNAKDIIVNRFDRNKQKSMTICKDCIPELLERMKKIEEHINNKVYYTSEIGITIYYNKYDRGDMYRDFIENKGIEDCVVIAIVSNELRMIFTRLRNIKEIVSILEDESKDETDKEICSMNCPKETSVTRIGNLYMCASCKEEIRRELLEYIEEEKEFVVSHSI